MPQRRTIDEALTNLVRGGIEEAAEQLRAELHIDELGQVTLEVEDDELPEVLEMLYGCNAPADVEAWLKSKFTPEQLEAKFDCQINEGDPYYFVKASAA